MIRNVLLPEQVRGYYLFSKRIVGIDINRTHIVATVVQASGYTITIERCIEEKLDPNSTELQERITHGLKTVMRSIGSYNEIRTAINSSYVIFKELTLPFVSYEKIKLAVEFEVDPLLPFSVHDAVVDFIITNVNAKENKADILVAALQKQHVIAHLHLFESAGISPDVVTVDLFALYDLYKRIPAYQNEQDAVALVDIGSQVTTIGYIVQGQLHYVRSLSKGMGTIARTLSKELDLQPGQAIGDIFRYGLQKDDDPRYMQAITKATQEFWNDVAFTLLSFGKQHTASTNQKIILLGRATDIDGLPEFLHKHIKINCEVFDIVELWKSNTITNKIKHPIRTSQMMSISIALPSFGGYTFNLRQKEFFTERMSLLCKQMIMSTLLLLLLLGSFISFIFLQVHSLKNESIYLEQETIEEIKERFPKIGEEVDRLDDVIDDAQKEVGQQERLLSAFLRSSTTSFLGYLLELTTILDKEELGLEVQQLSIKEDKIILSARVRDYEALKILEYDLAQSPLFKRVEPQENPDFTMEITLAQRNKHGNY